jgi:hypothetical protein
MNHELGPGTRELLHRLDDAAPPAPPFNTILEHTPSERRSRAVPTLALVAVAAGIVGLAAVSMTRNDNPTGELVAPVDTAAGPLIVPQGTTPDGRTFGPTPHLDPGEVEPDDERIPDFVSVLTRDGEQIAGFVDTELLDAGVNPLTVYASDLTTVVGHWYAGVGFVPLGEQPPAIVCDQPSATVSQTDGSVACTPPPTVPPTAPATVGDTNASSQLPLLVAGIVRDPEGQPAANVRVVVLVSPPDHEIDELEPGDSFHMDQVAETRTDDRGRFEVHADLGSTEPFAGDGFADFDIHASRGGLLSIWGFSRELSAGGLLVPLDDEPVISATVPKDIAAPAAPPVTTSPPRVIESVANGAPYLEMQLELPERSSD